MFTVALLTVAKTWKQLKCPLTDEWMKNMCKYIPKMEYYSAIKKNEIVPFAATWMDIEIIIVSKSDRERQISYHIYVESKKIIQLNLSTE